MTKSLRRAAATTSASLVLLALQPAFASAATHPSTRPAGHHDRPPATLVLPVRVGGTYAGAAATFTGQTS